VDWDEMAVVGRIARPHGLRGQVVVNPETDFPDERFSIGQTLYVAGGDRPRAVTIAGVRFHHGRPIVAFSGVDDIAEAETLQHAELRAPLEDLEKLPAGSFYHHDLVGCTVVTRAGESVGIVSRVEGPREASRLVIGEGDSEVLIPLAADICIEVDPAGRRIVIDPPEGLLDLNRRTKHDAPGTKHQA
jgi:16S rRNA processing protein RimM